MKKEELLNLGFIDTSYADVEQFTLEINEFTQIETYRNYVDICFFGDWINVPNCKTIYDMKNLIKLFS